MADTVLLIASDKAIRSAVSIGCDQLNLILVDPPGLDEAKTRFAIRSPDLIVCDYEFFEEVRATWAGSAILLYADEADSEQAIGAIKGGALDYLVPPITVDLVVRRIRDALRFTHEVQLPDLEGDVDEIAPDVDRIIGQSPAMKDVYKLIGLIAPRDINVLITGESGTGKEVVARAILQHSGRKDAPFLAVNCAAIPETLLESELFGHEKGAFTGAHVRRIGKFEQCDEGTLFLDEVGDMPMTTQAKLLRVLQDNTFQRLGGTETISCDVRIIAATNQPLEELIEKKLFRQDLYYRLNVATIRIPSLREREVDVVLLAHYFVNRYNREFGTSIQRFSPETLPLLLNYTWPGNVRELENAIKAALVVARGVEFLPEFLPEHIRTGVSKGMMPSEGRRGERAKGKGLELQRFADELARKDTLDGKLHGAALGLIEREVIRAALQYCDGNMTAAAKRLGISRTTLRKKMHDHGISVSTSPHIRADNA